ncbi:MAG: hypothetical protein PHI23_02695, partial [Candidatus Peribacteraceae bacterium]|nr:hypothetical protein [Candidatus Peribacteraceae bacterium]
SSDVPQAKMSYVEGHVVSVSKDGLTVCDDTERDFALVYQFADTRFQVGQAVHFRFHRKDGQLIVDAIV